MRRATVTIPDELEKALDSYERDLEFPPSLAAVMQTTLEEYPRGRARPTLGLCRSRPETHGVRGCAHGSGEKTAAEMVVEDRR